MYLILCGCHISVHGIVTLIVIDQIYWNFVKCVLEIYWKLLMLDL